MSTTDAPRPTPRAGCASETCALTKAEWIVSLRQLLSLRRFWKRDRSTVCGTSWIADYGPLPCDRPHGHDGMHRTYGSQGPIAWRTLADDRAP